jgi:hypothetical protein
MNQAGFSAKNIIRKPNRTETRTDTESMKQNGQREIETAQVEHRDYLGKPDAVANLLSSLIDGIVVDLSAAETEQQIQTIIDDIHCQSECLADILLGGLNPIYPPRPGWNEPGGIDQFLKQRFPEIKETEPVQIIAWACDRYVRTILGLIKDQAQTGKPGDWKGAAELIVKQYASMLSGQGQQRQSTH